MVLAVNRRPFLGDLARRQPQPETEKVARNRVQIQCAVRLMTMQEDGHRRDGDVGQDQCHHDITPPGQVDQTVKPFHS
ncbi:hypothetical protein D3C85_1682610 [compost metagenome]